jgi:rhodanese-related sulfurtransferase
MRGGEFKKLLESRAKAKYCIMDIREPEEHERLCLDEGVVDKKYPLMTIRVWEHEVKAMDKAKPIVLVVSYSLSDGAITM